MVEAAVVTIRRQVLEVDLHGPEAQGHALQRRLPRACADVLSPAIESALGPFDAADRFLYLDRLDLQVTVTSLDGFEAELADAVRHGIEEHLARQSAPEGGPASVRARAGLGESPATARIGTAAQALAVFLRTGRLPWWFALPPEMTLEQVVLSGWAEVGGARGGLSTGGPIRTALGDWVARERLVAQFTPGFVLNILRALSPELAAHVDRIETALGAEAGTISAGPAFLGRVRQAALEAAVAGSPPAPAELLRRAWALTSAGGRAEPALTALVEGAWPGIATGAVASPFGPATGAGHDSPTPADLRAPIAGHPAPATGPEPVPAAAARPACGPLPDDDQVERLGMLVDHAGIVLLHPFLPRFFTGLGVAAGDELVDPDRALALLHHLATAEVVAPEHRLTLAKALCGLPLEAPCTADVGLTSVETAEATALLEASIEHWAALRHTSPDGLRAEFLQRPGVLSVLADGDWLLRVEDRTVDILLDQLPWGFSPLRLPWMTRLMTVEWR